METNEVIFKRFVKCIDNHTPSLKNWKVYWLIKETDNWYIILNSRDVSSLWKEYFVECDEQWNELKKEVEFKVGDYVYNFKDKYFDKVLDDGWFFINTETFWSNKNNRYYNFRLATPEEIEKYFK